MEQRTLVLMSKSAAPDNWHRPFAELLEIAEAGADGFETIQQGKAGSGDARYWDLNVRIPGGWAAYRQGDAPRHTTAAFLHIQNY